MSTKEDREKAAKLVACPICKSRPHFSCVRYKGIKPISLTHPHQERIKAAEEQS